VEFHDMKDGPIQRTIGILALLYAFVLPVAAQQDRGELRIDVRDPQGAAVAATGEMVSIANQFRLNFQVEADGRFVAKGLAFGLYRVSLSHG
jgi:hypothetical protein